MTIDGKERLIVSSEDMPIFKIPTINCAKHGIHEYFIQTSFDGKLKKYCSKCVFELLENFDVHMENA